MNFFERFKDFFGQLSGASGHNRGRENYWNHDEDESEDNFGRFTPRGFNVFTDPLEMQKYFEQQIQDLMRSFNMHAFEGFDDAAPNLPNGSFMRFFDHHNALEGAPDSPGALRDQFLKPGYEQPKISEKPNDRTDKDIDGMFNAGDFDKMFQKNHESKPKFFKYGQSVSTKIVVRPDGSQEIHRTSKDNEGNEEITLTKKIGDKEHTVITRKKNDGQEERIENFINIDEKEAGSLLVPDKNEREDPTNYEMHPWFGKFFK